MPTPILALIYWLHLTATVIWLGGLASLTLVVWPGLIRRPRDEAHQVLLDAIERRFWPLANVSLVLLIVTGTLQMGDDPHYAGFLKVGSPWTIGLLVKHVVIAAIVIVSMALQGSVRPELERIDLLVRRGDGQASRKQAALRRRVNQLTVLSFGLGILVLMATAFITALL
jgi:uncharacterized membrane protein